MSFRVVALLGLVLSGSAYAAEINAVPLAKSGEGAIFIIGDIRYEDRENFLSKISPFSSGVVVMWMAWSTSMPRARKGGSGHMVLQRLITYFNSGQVAVGLLSSTRAEAL